MNDVVFFELNNWFAGRDYPLIPFITENLYKFSDDEYFNTISHQLQQKFYNYKIFLN